ncbi:MAG TPA: UDP-N-acetylglucosamine diphosphorylase/glucosamine-1-phosphate N-acetyltransferase, partial [Chromatiales bacterium]|nr:UDP-N-acetylglucosamine diphosphorylase/glucosamine-1-phosphate N-acetyltransferase [Chromatiales bacterium]
MTIRVVILAAGQGTRMRSAMPKVLHTLAGKPMLEHVIDVAAALAPSAVDVVYGHGGDQVREQLAHCDVGWVAQTEQKGTGHAVAQASGTFSTGELVLVLYGDVPLIQLATLEHLLVSANDGRLGLLTVELTDPRGYGRIVRSDTGAIQRIVEHKDASEDELNITEVNTGILAVDGERLNTWLAALKNDNAQGEYYLTDVIEMAVSDGVDVVAVHPASEAEVAGVNDRVQLATLERIYQRQRADELMRAGVTLADPSRLDIRGSLRAGQDCFIDVNVIVEGEVILGDGVSVGANTVIKNSVIDDNVAIDCNCVIDHAHVGARSVVGPFARLRPETFLAEQTHIGNFVEIKKSSVGNGSK